MRETKYRLIIRADRGTVSLIGYEQPDGKIVAQNDEYIVVKYPAHQYWSGQGMQSYASPETCVYRIIEKPDEMGKVCTVVTHQVIHWEHKRRKKKS